MSPKPRTAYGIPIPESKTEGVRKCMQSNKGRDTGPELKLRALLRENGMSGYRLQWKVHGRPDVCYPGRRIAVFVNGCFWHRCPLCNPSSPKTNTEFWNAKFEHNVERDRRNTSELESEGWTVVTVWECELKRHPDEVVARIRAVWGRGISRP